MQGLIYSISNPGDIVFYTFAGSGSGSYTTSRAYMLLQLHRRCVVSDYHPDFRKRRSQKLVDVFAKRGINDSPDIKGTCEVKSTATTFVRNVESLRTRKHIEA